MHYLNVVSHHFMSATELETPVGRERLDLCVFRVAIDGETVPMCRVNATDLRERFYAQFEECLEPADVARTVMFAVQQPAHVVISQIAVVPSTQG